VKENSRWELEIATGLPEVDRCDLGGEKQSPHMPPDSAGLPEVDRCDLGGEKQSPHMPPDSASDCDEHRSLRSFFVPGVK
jgi:hypothetical protein